MCDVYVHGTRHRAIGLGFGCVSSLSSRDGNQLYLRGREGLLHYLLPREPADLKEESSSGVPLTEEFKYTEVPTPGSRTPGSEKDSHLLAVESHGHNGNKRQ